MDRATSRKSGRVEGAKGPPLRRQPAILGVGVGVILIPVHFLVDKATSVAIASVLLAVIAGAYFGFAVADGRLRMILVETLSCLFFGLAALAGLLWSPLAIPIAIICHGLWDIAHVLPWFRAEVPDGYPLFCFVVDFVIGGILLVLYLL